VGKKKAAGKAAGKKPKKSAKGSGKEKPKKPDEIAKENKAPEAPAANTFADLDEEGKQLVLQRVEKQRKIRKEIGIAVLEETGKKRAYDAAKKTREELEDKYLTLGTEIEQIYSGTWQRDMHKDWVKADEKAAAKGKSGQGPKKPGKRGKTSGKKVDEKSGADSKVVHLDPDNLQAAARHIDGREKKGQAATAGSTALYVFGSRKKPDVEAAQRLLDKLEEDGLIEKAESVGKVRQYRKKKPAA